MKNIKKTDLRIDNLTIVARHLDNIQRHLYTSASCIHIVLSRLEAAENQAAAQLVAEAFATQLEEPFAQFKTSVLSLQSFCEKKTIRQDA